MTASGRSSRRELGYTYGLYDRESLDERARDIESMRENPVCDFVRNGIFEPLGGLAAPEITTNKRRVYAERLSGEEILIPDEYIFRLRGEPFSYLPDTDGVVRDHATAPLLSYHPAYSDNPPNPPSKMNGNVHPYSLFYGLSKKKVAKDSESPTPIVWSVPFRGRHGTYCGILHVPEGHEEAGEQLNIVCGDNADYVLVARLHCWRLACFNCGWDAAMRKAREINERIEVYKKLQLQSERRIVHVVVSPPQDEALRFMRSKEGFRIMVNKVIRVLKDFQVDTGALVFHPWRQCGDRDGSFPSSSFVWRAGPHFHAVGYGYVPEDRIKEFHERTGWILKVVHDKSDVVSPTATLAYLLTHAGLGYPVTEKGIGRQMDVVRYFGGLARGEISRIATLEFAKASRCPVCGGELHYMDDDFKLCSHIHKTGIFAKALDSKNERSLFEQYLDDYAELDVPRDPDNYDLLWYFCQREKVQFLGKEGIFRKGDAPDYDDGLDDEIADYGGDM
ncbi:hypothetical protein TALC_00400 [Thermoplasmatales archaeon BRNA1]|nr:hypothetical protein TALC_00400 [Thermoplasmatales archaeon BRNA1]